MFRLTIVREKSVSGMPLATGPRRSDWPQYRRLTALPLICHLTVALMSMSRVRPPAPGNHSTFYFFDGVRNRCWGTNRLLRNSVRASLVLKEEGLESPTCKTLHILGT